METSSSPHSGSPEHDVEICKSFCGENFVLENTATEIEKCECEGNCLAWNESKKFIRADGIGTDGKVASLCVKCFC